MNLQPIFFFSRKRWCLAVLCVGFLLAVWVAPGQAHTSTGALFIGTEVTQVAGVVPVEGWADHPQFRKWQLDLLLNQRDPTFLAVSETPLHERGVLTTLDTTRYPDGQHQLRLRVVHTNLNYDEYWLEITIANGQVAQETPVPTPTPVAEPTAPPPPANGLDLEATNLRGSVDIRGVAHHPTFRKWQLDLLRNGDQTQATFLALGEEPVHVSTLLTTLDTTLYPNGLHVLRLRVVHSNLNYDEFFTTITIDNQGSSVQSNSPSNAGSITNSYANRAIRAGDGSNSVVYLTFDDGPNGAYTNQVLDLLARYNAKATFFIVGANAQGKGDLIRRMYQAGHGIGNHTWNHARLTGMSETTFAREVGSAANLFGKYAAPCLRPPYGATDATTYTNATRLGYSVVLWSIDPLDWQQPGSQVIANRVLSNIFPGAIVLLHDGPGNRSQTVAALETILATLSAQGYSFQAYCR